MMRHNGNDVRVPKLPSPSEPDKPTGFGQWVITKGGEYFFPPSISVIKNLD